MTTTLTEPTHLVEYEFTSTHYCPGLPSWHTCGRHHGARWRIVLEFADPTDPETTGDATVIQEYQAWAAATFGSLHGDRSLMDVVPDGGLGTLAQLVWEEWHRRLHGLRAIAVDESVGGTIGYPEGASTEAVRISRAKARRRWLREAEHSLSAETDYDPGLGWEPVVQAIEAAGRAAKRAAAWGESAYGMEHLHECDRAWRTLMDEAPFDDAEAKTAITEGVQSWLDACRAVGAALRVVAGRCDDDAVDLVAAARSAAGARSQSWGALLDEHLPDTADSARWCAADALAEEAGDVPSDCGHRDGTV
jgi:hypothetical protein